MGISDRDYVRTSSRSSSAGGFGWDVIGWLIAVTVVAFVLQLLIQPSFTDWFDLDPMAVLHGQIWRLITFDFLHSPNNVWHIIVNLYVLYIAGQRLLSNHTEKEFLLFYLASGLVAGVSFVLWQLGRGSDVPAVGASGSVAAVLALYALHWPHDRWLFFYVLPVPVIVLVILSAALDLYPVLRELGGGPPAGQIAHTAHLGGMAFAFVYYKRDWKLELLLGDLSLEKFKRRFRRSPKLKVHRPATEEESRFDMQSRMDELLEKISREGEVSLTSEERDTLNRISRQLRSRKV
jgi:membrane associated rhomboid family serine protease